MDPTQEKTLEEMLAKLSDTITISSPSLDGYTDANGWSDPQYGAIPPLTVSNINGNINGTSHNTISLTGSPLTFSNTAGHVWATTGTAPYTINPYNQSAK
jgi:hypothetical protein